jgi:serine/threonine protein phosphatase 1
MHYHIDRYVLNETGRDFVVGDIHGCFKLLDHVLYNIGFDDKVDRLFSVGDLVDRGLESEKCLEWIAKPWFHSVLGNHEQLAIDCGSWFLDLDESVRKEYVSVFSKLPVAIEVETKKGFVGIVHATCPCESWSDLYEAISGENQDAFVQYMTWDRDRIKDKNITPIKDIHSVIVGHTPLTTDLILGNIHYIDTGAVFTNNLTIIEI